MSATPDLVRRTAAVRVKTEFPGALCQPRGPTATTSRDGAKGGDRRKRGGRGKGAGCPDKHPEPAKLQVTARFL